MDMLIIFLFAFSLVIIIAAIASAPQRSKRKQKAKELYDQTKKDFFNYAKLIDNIVNEPQKLATEEVWNKWTTGGRFPETAIKTVKEVYDDVVQEKTQYDKIVDKILGPFKDMPIPQIGLEMDSVKEQFAKYYVYNSNPILPFTNSLRRIIDELQTKKDTFQFMHERGQDVGNLSDAEDFFLIQAKGFLPRFEAMVDQAKEYTVHAEMQEQHEEMMYQLREQQRIATAQGKEVQSILKTGKGRSAIDVLFDTHEYKN